jgi:hypothetical protein
MVRFLHCSHKCKHNPPFGHRYREREKPLVRQILIGYCLKINANPLILQNFQLTKNFLTINFIVTDFLNDFGQ